MNIFFDQLHISDKFILNGNVYQKMSTRTARLLENGHVFYFSMNDCIYAIDRQKYAELYD